MSRGKNHSNHMDKNNMGKTEIIGIDTMFEPPLNSDLVLEVDKLSEEETFKCVLDYIENRYGL